MHFSNWTDTQRREWFERCIASNQAPIRDLYNWGIELKKHTSLIGWFGIGSSSHPTLEGERSFGYLLSRQFWGQGYMSEVLRAIIIYEFDTLKTPRLSATCEVKNHASVRVMRKAGMQLKYTVYDTDFEGNWVYRHHYALDRQDYERQKQGNNSSTSN